MNLISFIIPVYRNEETLHHCYDSIKELMEEKHPELDVEFLFIDDGSDDGSWKVIESLRAMDSRVRAISFSRNFGQVPAIIAGARNCKGAAAIIMSADLQDPVSMISEMIHSWQNAAQIVVAYRKEREDSYLVNLVSSIFYRFIKLSVPLMPRGGFDFVLLDRAAINVFSELNERNRFFQGDILWMGFNIKFLPYKRLKRKLGRSQWTFRKKLKYFIDGSLNTSYLPIRFMSLLGILTAFLGFVYALVVVYARLINQVPFKGYAPIVILLLVIGGVIMIMLGVIGEYLWRIHDESRKRPEYIIQKRIDETDE